MKKVKRLTERNPWRLVSHPETETVWFDLWGSSYATFTASEAERLREALDLIFSEQSR